MNRFKILMSQLMLTFIMTTTYGQTGVFYYISDPTNLPNSKVIDIIETPEGNIVMLDRAADDKYLNPVIHLLTTDKIGTLQKNVSAPVENLYDLVKISPFNESSFLVFGNLTLNKQYEATQVTIDDKGTILSQSKESQVYSTLISDVKKVGAYYFVLYTKSGKNEKYNITLNKVEASTNQVVWLKKISSEQNEEADKIAVLPDGRIDILGKKYNDEMTEYVPIIYQIDENGNQVWKKGIDLPSNFSCQSFSVNDAKEIVYLCGYTKNPTGFSETRLVRLSSTGEELNYVILSDFSANGLIALKNKTYIAYGSRFYVDQKQVVTKAKYVIFDPMLRELTSKTLDDTDKPDKDLIQQLKTSSDLNTATQLMDGRIALAGKIFMPVAPNNPKKQNVPLLILIDSDGTYQK
ncbi:MAG TPA: hypothetical protein DCQ26_08140 [Marinilabiliales bacterium]|nr:MAG: hypothetical protein A2W95_17085 [Bacteroidetes bacterium GWA2_40_14]OFZ29224.1 MAG: hypothetical protein A2437_05695 [Bacteroidetes bacterium RIFOXYC2_FULL_40_12]HAM98570.1 hypothetical protein [Marinilabiliales bacterium]HAZ04006.1 hypothetical protein [Marinilabiliales bacterium]HBO76431.1 hypothetical protein [Marinilabiliales bacterium]